MPCRGLGEKRDFFGPAGGWGGEAGHRFGGRPEPRPDARPVVLPLHPLGVPGAAARESLTEGLLWCLLYPGDLCFSFWK